MINFVYFCVFKASAIYSHFVWFYLQLQELYCMGIK